MKTARIFRALGLIQAEREASWNRERKFKATAESSDVDRMLLKIAELQTKKLDAVRNALLECLCPNDWQPTEDTLKRSKP